MAIRRIHRPAVALIAAAAPLLILTGCSSNSNDSASSPASASQQQAALVVSDQWVKASDEHMTALFAVFSNNSDNEIRIVSGSTPVAGEVQLHETVSEDGVNVMKEKKDGFAIPANGSLAMKPGGDHIMLMDLKEHIAAGQPVTVELRMSDGSTQSVTAVARDFAGNQENYQP
ncbi:copper chaperone PCu(A)C [Gordonia phosphorivorans]|uniref:Copper chaperone PCu(A)C n=1 Tax=Gordonia phosphorivorans TaxID=1056982 RepID=A0ABV6HEE1_9ACTN